MGAFYIGIGFLLSCVRSFWSLSHNKEGLLVSLNGWYGAIVLCEILILRNCLNDRDVNLSSVKIIVPGLRAFRLVWFVPFQAAPNEGFDVFIQAFPVAKTSCQGLHPQHS